MKPSWMLHAYLQGPVARSMVSVNQRLIPWQRIGFNTAYPMVKTNHALSNSALGNCNTEVKTAVSIFLWHCKIYTLTTFEKMKKKL